MAIINKAAVKIKSFGVKIVSENKSLKNTTSNVNIVIKNTNTTTNTTTDKNTNTATNTTATKKPSTNTAEESTNTTDRKVPI